MCIDDYHPDVKHEDKLKQKLKFTDNATISSKDVKESRNTVEELTEKEYEKRIGKVKQTSIKFSDIK
tara:strand:- start:1404 stop:1604 length:201 start_codon:yes stop_codon:yes gene_type:complete